MLTNETRKGPKMNDHDDQPKAMAPENMCSRMSARSIIESKIQDLHRRADQLQGLLDALPSKLPLKADEALWEMVLSVQP